jgi:ABC-2 type transport system ATP-binding protein
MNTIELKNVQKSFGAVRAVNDVSLSIQQGSVFGLIGRNGAGKTTTIRMIMNIYQPDKGEILYHGEPVDATFRDHVGYLPEERGLYGKMKIIDALMFFAEIKSAPMATVKESALAYLKRFGLADRSQHKIETLSKGNQQKVQFIAAILHDPDIVILDEPFSGLDPVNTTLMINMIQELKQRNKAILFSTHIMDFAERLCDQIALIDQGNVILEGSIADVKTLHGSNQVAIVSTDDLTFVDALPYVTTTERMGKTLNVKLQNSPDIQALLAELVRRNVEVTKFDASPITLHEIFVSLAGHGDDVLGTMEVAS